MTDTQLYLLIGAAFAVTFSFVAGMLYINKRLRENKSMKGTVVIPILGSFIMAIILLIIAYSQT